jgi:hypothetical protein
MASPQRVDPGNRGAQNKPGFEKNQSRTLEQRRRRTVWYWWWGFWIVIFAAAIGWGVWGAVNGNGWWFVGRQSPGRVHAPPMNGPGVAVLESANKQSFVGQKFQANFVPVQKKISDRVFWVGAKNATPTLLVVKKSGTAGKNGTTIQKGNLIDITGTMQKAPPQAQAQQQWHLSSSGAARLEQEGGYIDASLAYYVPR